MIDTAFKIIDIFSLILYTLALILSLVIAAVVVYLKLYHGNLRVLLINVSFTHCFVLINGLAINVIDVFEIKSYGRWILQNLMTLCIWATAFNLLCLVFERLAASLFDKKYETMCSGLPLLGITFVALDWILAGIFLALAKLEITPNKNLAIIAVVIILIVLLIFSFMPSLTYKRYINAATKEFSLSQRYQMSENYRSAKLLTKVVWCFGGTTVLAGIFFVLSILVNSDIIYILYDYAFISQTIFYPLLVIYYEIKVRDLIFCNKIQRNFVATTITGQNLMIVGSDEQQKAYFNAYKQAWA